MLPLRSPVLCMLMHSIAATWYQAYCYSTTCTYLWVMVNACIVYTAVHLGNGNVFFLCICIVRVPVACSMFHTHALGIGRAP